MTEFEAVVVRLEMPTNVRPHAGIVLDRTAFYPTSGGQLFDTGWLRNPNKPDGIKLRVVEVSEASDGDVVHWVELLDGVNIGSRGALRGSIDRLRRRDHMQQHTGQHLLSAVFIERCNAPTVSFHMGDESCTIDLDVKSLSPEQMGEVERRSNEIISDDVPVEIKCARRRSAPDGRAQASA